MITANRYNRDRTGNPPGDTHGERSGTEDEGPCDTHPRVGIAAKATDGSRATPAYVEGSGPAGTRVTSLLNTHPRIAP